jgi:hypothetical protein
MAKQAINIGRTANDKSGDPLRRAFEKINNNFDELYANLTTYLPNPTGNAGKFLTTNGTILSWSTLPTSSPTTSPITASPTPPNTHPDGTLWYDEVSGRLYVYYDSGWVDASPRGIGVATSVSQGTKLANDSGTTGQISYDANYIYICTATNTWKRSPLTGGY